MANSPAYLGSQPVAVLDRQVGPAESVDFQNDLGSDNAALHPTLGLACGKTNSSNRASAATRACND